MQPLRECEADRARAPEYVGATQVDEDVEGTRDGFGHGTLR